MDRIWGMSKLGILGLALAVGSGVALAQATGGGGMGQQPQQPGSTSPTQPGATSPSSMNSPDRMDAMNQANLPGGASMQDKAFLHSAAEGGMFEVQAGQLAGEKGQSADVKQFGQWMVKDHTKLNQTLAPFAQQAGIKAPTELKGKEKSEYAKLQGMSGDAFDKAYIATMVKDHKHDLSAFKAEADSTQMPALKTAVMQGEQVITLHLDKIKQIASAQGATKSGM